jgi:hypothetical protein
MSSPNVLFVPRVFPMRGKAALLAGFLPYPNGYALLLGLF